MLYPKEENETVEQKGLWKKSDMDYKKNLVDYPNYYESGGSPSIYSDELSSHKRSRSV